MQRLYAVVHQAGIGASIHNPLACRLTIWQGAEVSEDKPITFPFFRMVPLSGNMRFTDDLYESAEAKAPEYLNQAGVAGKLSD